MILAHAHHRIPIDVVRLTYLVLVDTAGEGHPLVLIGY